MFAAAVSGTAGFSIVGGWGIVDSLFVFEAGNVLSEIGSEESILRLKVRADGEEVVAEHTAAIN
jgi:hypothetical protein